MGWCLSIDGLPGEDAEQLNAWLQPIMDAVLPWEQRMAPHWVILPWAWLWAF
ncbi:MAG: hypothetical protein AB1457_17625 [Chloroflexota bacterium]|nr:MAG: hypothetical protein KatS3mg047_0046 [Bellilinea sp.]